MSRPSIVANAAGPDRSGSDVGVEDDRRRAVARDGRRIELVPAGGEVGLRLAAAIATVTTIRARTSRRADAWRHTIAPAGAGSPARSRRCRGDRRPATGSSGAGRRHAPRRSRSARVGRGDGRRRQVLGIDLGVRDQQQRPADLDVVRAGTCRSPGRATDRSSGSSRRCSGRSSRTAWRSCRGCRRTATMYMKKRRLRASASGATKDGIAGRARRASGRGSGSAWRRRRPRTGCGRPGGSGTQAASSTSRATTRTPMSPPRMRISVHVDDLAPRR